MLLLLRNVLALAFLALLLSLPLAADSNFKVLKNLVPTPRGAYPTAGLTKGRDGNFYGTTARGGVYNCGTAFKLTPSGILTTLANFNGTTDGSGPNRLTPGTDGNFYGTTSQASFDNGESLGTIFRLTPEGVLTTLVTFDGDNGALPYANLTLGSDGNFYGCTSDKGPGYGYGTVFKMTHAGVLTTLYIFKGGSNGTHPSTALVEGRDGNFYGTTTGEYAYTSTTIFRISPTGSLVTLYRKTSEQGSHAPPLSPLIQGSDGNFYFTSSVGGVNESGAVLKMTPGGRVTTLTSFREDDFYDNVSPSGGLIEGKDGNFYGTTELFNGNGSVFRVTPGGTLTEFPLPRGTGASGPLSGVLQDNMGNFYGTTQWGGASSVSFPDNGVGAIFKMSPEGLFETIYSFQISQGSAPHAGLVEGTDGTFYGTTSEGGKGNGGTVFKVSSKGVLNTLVSFKAEDFVLGSAPTTALTKGLDGNLYGTTSFGRNRLFKTTPEGELTFIEPPGDVFSGDYFSSLLQVPDGSFYFSSVYGGRDNDGAFFHLLPDGTGKTLLSCDGTHGQAPETGLILGSDGDLYGTDSAGGKGDGEVFKISPQGKFTRLHAFAGKEGASPASALLLGKDGNYYGTTEFGNTDSFYSDQGTIFKMTPKGEVTTLALFNGENGAHPRSALVQDADGNLYGTTEEGGDGNGYSYFGEGTLFKLTPAGVLSTLVRFRAVNGSTPNGLVLGKDGNLYGTTQAGGTADAGVIFTLALAQPAQAITFPPVGTVTVGDEVDLKAASSSRLPITYSVLEGTATIVDNHVTFTGIGLVKLAANQAGGSGYRAAPQVVINVRVLPPTQTITFPPLPRYFYVDEVVTLGATASSGLPVSYSYSTTPKVVSENQVSFPYEDEVTIFAQQAGSPTFRPAKQVLRKIHVIRRNQRVTFPSLGPVTVGQTVDLTATSTSGATVYFYVEGPVTRSGNKLTFTTEGFVRITAVSYGNYAYKDAPPVPQELTVGPALK